jgi:hypothetical protein
MSRIPTYVDPDSTLATAYKSLLAINWTSGYSAVEACLEDLAPKAPCTAVLLSCIFHRGTESMITKKGQSPTAVLPGPYPCASFSGGLAIRSVVYEEAPLRGVTPEQMLARHIEMGAFSWHLFDEGIHQVAINITRIPTFRTYPKDASLEQLTTFTRTVTRTFDDAPRDQYYYTTVIERDKGAR